MAVQLRTRAEGVSIEEGVGFGPKPFQKGNGFVEGSFKNLLMPLFLMGSFQAIFKRENGPLRDLG